MKKRIGIVIIIILFILLGINWHINSEEDYLDKKYIDTSYLNEAIFDDKLFDYTNLTGLSENVAREYFEDLKLNKTDYSVKLMKQLNVYGTEPMKTILNIQQKYDEITENLTVNEKVDLDKYLLKNTLIFYNEIENYNDEYKKRF